MMILSIISGLTFTVSVGIGDFLQSILARDIGRYKTLFVRHLLTLIILAPFFIYFHIKGLFNISMASILWLTVGTVFYLAGYINFLKAFEIGNVSIVSPISSAGAAVTVTLCAIFLNEHLSVLSYISIGTIIIGIGLTSTDIRKLKELKSVKGLKESIFTMFLFGFYFFTIGAAGKSTDPINLFMFAMGIQSAFFVTYNFIRSKDMRPRDLKGKRILIFLAITLLYILAWIGFNYGASKGIVSIVAPVSALYPVITVVLATLFYKEKLVLNQILGIVITITGLMLLNSGS